MKNVHLYEFSLENIVNQPALVKIIVTSGICLIIFLISYYFYDYPQLQIFKNEKQIEIKLRQDFGYKKRIAANLLEYKNKLQKDQLSYHELVRHLSTSNQLFLLFDEISQMALANGLRFKLFKPMPVIEREVAMEFPLQISVMGNYFQLANFINNISQSSHLIIVSDFSIEPLRQDDEKNMPDNELLTMDLILKIYQYHESIKNLSN